jgi:protein required for attachment to host cells
MTSDWILIANAAHARLLQRDERGRLDLLKRFEHAESRMRSSLLGSAPDGGEPGGRGYGRSAFVPRLDAQHREHLHFALELSRALEEGARQHRYASLMIFAGNPFLGELKKQLGDATRHLLTEKHAVDLTQVGLAEMPQRIEHERQQPR